MTPMAARHTRFEAIGTKWLVEVRDTVTDESWESLLVCIYARIQEFDKAYSRFRADSLVSTLALKAGKHDLPADGFSLLAFYEKLYRATDGKVTPLIGQAIADAGYDAEYSLRPKGMKAVPRWEDVISYDETSITLQQPALLDFGAAGKGYLIDIVAGLLAQDGIENFTIDASGDILHRSSDGSLAQIGLENPLDTTEAIGVVGLQNKSLCASAGTKRQWGKFTHILDPQKLESPREVLATWALADDTTTADGLATALFFTDPESLQKQFDFSWAILNNDMSLEYAKDFPAQIFTAG
jgi:thiamine biosynthesis lipoprotein